MSDLVVKVLQFGALGLLALVLAGGFVLLKSGATMVRDAFHTHAAATKDLAKAITEQEARSVERHHNTTERMRDLIEDQTSEIKNHVNDKLRIIELRLLGRPTPEPFAAVRPSEK